WRSEAESDPERTAGKNGSRLSGQARTESGSDHGKGEWRLRAGRKQQDQRWPRRQSTHGHPVYQRSEMSNVQVKSAAHYIANPPTGLQARILPLVGILVVLGLWTLISGLQL